MPGPWIAEAIRSLGLLAGGLLLGLLTGDVMLFLLLALAGYLGWHLYNLYRLDQWLHESSRYYPPEADGIWGEVLHQLYRLRRRNRRRKKRIARLVREFRMSTAAMPDGVVLLNPQQEIVWSNHAAETMLGLIGGRDAGQRISNLVRAPEFARYLEDGEGGRSVEIDAEGERRLSLQLVPYGDEQWLLLIKDVTRIEQLERMRKDFVANASHELRSPLTVVSGYLEGLREDEVPAGWERPLGEMHRQLERMREIVDDLLELSRLEGEESQAPGAEVDVPGLLAALVEDARISARPGQVLELELDTRMRVLGSEAELHSAFSNLILNACKYTPEGGRIEVRWAEGPEGASLTVRDSGPGIAQEHLPRLTERFYRVDRGRSRDAGGSGLGLAIVRHALQRHGARLQIDSAPGRGSRFSCVFPPERLVPSR